MEHSKKIINIYIYIYIFSTYIYISFFYSAILSNEFEVTIFWNGTYFTREILCKQLDLKRNSNVKNMCRIGGRFTMDDQVTNQVLAPQKAALNPNKNTMIPMSLFKIRNALYIFIHDKV